MENLNENISPEEIKLWNDLKTLDGKIRLLKKFRTDLKWLRLNGRMSKSKKELINTKLRINRRLRLEIKHFNQFKNWNWENSYNEKKRSSRIVKMYLKEVQKSTITPLDNYSATSQYGT